MSGSTMELSMMVHYQRLREHLLAERADRVYRELWNCEGVPYLTMRNHLSALKRDALAHSSGAPPSQRRRKASGASAAESAAAQSTELNYSFEGVRHIFDDSTSTITVVAFAKVRNDLLALGNATGDLWFIKLPAEGEAQVQQAQKIHADAITGVDWSFDNSQLLTCGMEGALCIWDAADGSCIRSLSLLSRLYCCRFHPLNPALALVGTTGGKMDIYSCSAGKVQGHYMLPAAGAFRSQRPHVTAVECSVHDTFLGDSAGNLHMYRCEMHQGQMPKLTWHSKLHVAATATATVLMAQHVPFCRVTGTPVLFVACDDGSLVMVKIVGTGQKARMEIHSRVRAPRAARQLFPAICPLSCIQDIPLVTLGGEDTNVYICDISARHVDKPAVVMTLKGHSAPVGVVNWAFDESLLATGDCDGCCIIWMRAP